MFDAMDTAAAEVKEKEQGPAIKAFRPPDLAGSVWELPWRGLGGDPSERAKWLKAGAGLGSRSGLPPRSVFKRTGFEPRELQNWLKPFQSQKVRVCSRAAQGLESLLRAGLICVFPEHLDHERLRKELPVPRQLFQELQGFLGAPPPQLKTNPPAFGQVFNTPQQAVCRCTIPFHHGAPCLCLGQSVPGFTQIPLSCAQDIQGPSRRLVSRFTCLLSLALRIFSRLHAFGTQVLDGAPEFAQCQICCRSRSKGQMSQNPEPAPQGFKH